VSTRRGEAPRRRSCAARLEERRTTGRALSMTKSSSMRFFQTSVPIEPADQPDPHFYKLTDGRSRRR
jgi:hypothetical protein